MSYIPNPEGQATPDDGTTNTHTCKNCWWIDNTGACAISTISTCVEHDKWYPITDEC